MSSCLVMGRSLVTTRGLLAVRLSDGFAQLLHHQHPARGVLVDRSEFDAAVEHRRLTGSRLSRSGLTRRTRRRMTR